MHSLSWTAFSFLILVLLVALSAQAADICNGHAEYCSRIWSNVSSVGSHDSAFVGSLPTQNQHLNVTAQLHAGIRFLQGQTHSFLGTLSMCHTSCLEEDAGSVEHYMTTVREFLDENPDEVIMLLLVNGDNVDPSLFDDAFTGSGLSKYAFTPSSGSKVLPIDQWPTLDAMIQANSRLVFFLDAGADTSRYPYIMNEWDYFFETPYDWTDAAFAQCSLDRPPNSSPQGKMYIVNHFLDTDVGGILIPNEGAAATTNAATGSGSIGAQSAICEGLYGYAPKGVLLDYIDAGAPFDAEANLNSIS